MQKISSHTIKSGDVSIEVQTWSFGAGCSVQYMLTRPRPVSGALHATERTGYGDRGTAVTEIRGTLEAIRLQRDLHRSTLESWIESCARAGTTYESHPVDVQRDRIWTQAIVDLTQVSVALERYAGPA